MPRYFLDTSALVKHYHAEVGTETVRAILTDPDADRLVTRLTTVEILSAFAIKVRTGTLSGPDFQRLQALFHSDVKRRRLLPIRMLNPDYLRAGDLIAKHGMSRQMRTLDALQLAVALRLDSLQSIDHFVSADQRLCEIAALEGLAIINPESA